VRVFPSAERDVVLPSKSTRLPPPLLRLRIISPVARVPAGVAIGSSKTMINVPTLAAAVTSRVDEVTPRVASGVLFVVRV